MKVSNHSRGEREKTGRGRKKQALEVQKRWSSTFGVRRDKAGPGSFCPYRLEGSAHSAERLCFPGESANPRPPSQIITIQTTTTRKRRAWKAAVPLAHLFRRQRQSCATPFIFPRRGGNEKNHVVLAEEMTSNRNELSFMSGPFEGGRLNP